MRRSPIPFLLAYGFLLATPVRADFLTHQAPEDFLRAYTEGSVGLESSGALGLGNGPASIQSRIFPTFLAPPFPTEKGVITFRAWNDTITIVSSPGDASPRVWLCRQGEWIFSGELPPSTVVDAEWTDGALVALMRPASGDPASGHVYGIPMTPDGRIGNPRLVALSPPGFVAQHLATSMDRVFVVGSTRDGERDHYMELRGIETQSPGWSDLGDASASNGPVDFRTAGDWLVRLSPAESLISIARLPSPGIGLSWKDERIPAKAWGTIIENRLAQLALESESPARVVHSFRLPKPAKLSSLHSALESNPDLDIRWRVAKADGELFSPWTISPASRSTPLGVEGQTLQYQFRKSSGASPAWINRVALHYDFISDGTRDQGEPEGADFVSSSSPAGGGANTAGGGPAEGAVGFDSWVESKNLSGSITSADGTSAGEKAADPGIQAGTQGTVLKEPMREEIASLPVPELSRSKSEDSATTQSESPEPGSLGTDSQSPPARAENRPDELSEALAGNDSGSAAPASDRPLDGEADVNAAASAMRGESGKPEGGAHSGNGGSQLESGGLPESGLLEGEGAGVEGDGLMAERTGEAPDGGVGADVGEAAEAVAAGAPFSSEAEPHSGIPLQGGQAGDRELSGQAGSGAPTGEGKPSGAIASGQPTRNEEGGPASGQSSGEVSGGVPGVAQVNSRDAGIGNEEEQLGQEAEVPGVPLDVPAAGSQRLYQPSSEKDGKSRGPGESKAEWSWLVGRNLGGDPFSQMQGSIERRLETVANPGADKKSIISMFAEKASLAAACVSGSIPIFFLAYLTGWKRRQSSEQENASRETAGRRHADARRGVQSVVLANKLGVVRGGELTRAQSRTIGSLGVRLTGEESFRGTIHWGVAEPMPAAMGSPVIFQRGERMYVADSSGTLCSVSIRPDGSWGSWRVEVGRLPRARGATTVAAIDDRLICMAGPRVFSATWRAETLGKWEEVGPIGEAEGVAHVQGAGKHVYVAGLWKDRSLLPLVRRLDFSAGLDQPKWVPLPPLPADVRTGALVVGEGRLYWIAGEKQSRVFSAALGQDGGFSRWEEEASVPEGMQHPVAFHSHAFLWVSETGRAHAKVFRTRLSPGTGRVVGWLPAGNSGDHIHEKAGFGCAGDQLVWAGGWIDRLRGKSTHSVTRVPLVARARGNSRWGKM